MKDVTIKDFGNTVGAGFCSINDKKVYFTNYYKIISEVYNELTDSEISFYELLKKYIVSCNSEDKLLEIINICENKLNENKPSKSKNIGDKWDGYTID